MPERPHVYALSRRTELASESREGERGVGVDDPNSLGPCSHVTLASVDDIVSISTQGGQKEDSRLRDEDVLGGICSGEEMSGP